MGWRAGKLVPGTVHDTIESNVARQSAGANRVIVVWRCEPHGDSCRPIQTPRNRLEAESHLDICGRKWLVDRKRNTLFRGLVSILLQGVAASHAIITDDSPLTRSRISCAPGVEVAWGDAHNIAFECDGFCVGDTGNPTRNGKGDKKACATPHPIAPSIYRPMPAKQQAASVGIMPTLNRKMAIAAATESKSAHRSTLAGFGASKDSGKARTAMV